MNRIEYLSKATKESNALLPIVSKLKNIMVNTGSNSATYAGYTLKEEKGKYKLINQAGVVIETW